MSEMETQAEHTTREDEGQKVEAWRLLVLLQANYPLVLAEKLAASDADLHVAVAFMQDGCPPATAARILL